MEEQVAKRDVEEIKRKIAEMMVSGAIPPDLAEHLAEMGVTTPDELMTTMLPEGHWLMMAEKWLKNTPEAPHQPQAYSAEMEMAAGPPGGMVKSARLHVDGENSSGGVGRLTPLQKEGVKVVSSILCDECKAGKISEYSQLCAKCKKMHMMMKGAETKLCKSCYSLYKQYPGTTMPPLEKLCKVCSDKMSPMA